MRSCLTSAPLCKIVSLIGLLWSGEAALAATPQVAIPPAHHDQFVGSAGCKSSSCHGGAGEKRSQYITWSQQDFHPRAYAVLVNARSARMAETLGVGSAQTSARCTVCHSPFQTVEPSRLTATARPDEGVSCESCHNAASSWFRGHTRPDWTYPMRVTGGMRDLRNFYVRANTCVACHQNVDNDLLAAGHPQLRFDLDGQSVAEPKHWQDPAGSGAKAWLVGQAVALREISWSLSNMENPSEEAIAKWNALVWLLAKVAARDARLAGFDAPGPPFTHAVFIHMQERADSLARSGSEASLGGDFPRLALLSLTATDNDFINGPESRENLFCRAERLAPAVYRLAVSAGVDSDSFPKQEGRALFEAIQTYGAFDPVRFGKALVAYREAIANPTIGQHH